jgi:hypothetical protein
VPVSAEDLVHDIRDCLLWDFAFLCDELAEVAVRAVLQDHVDVRFRPEDVVASDDVLVIEGAVDFYFSLEEGEAGGAEALELDGLHSIALELPADLYAPEDLAAVALPQQFVQQHLVLAYPDPLFALLEGPNPTVFGAAAMAQRSVGMGLMERVFLFGQIPHFKEYYRG